MKRTPGFCLLLKALGNTQSAMKKALFSKKPLNGELSMSHGIIIMRRSVSVARLMIFGTTSVAAWISEPRPIID